MNVFYATRNAIEALKPLQALIAENNDDFELVAGMVEGETNVFDVLNSLLEKRLENDILVQGTRAKRKELHARETTLEGRIILIDDALEVIFKETGLRKYDLPLGTLSFAKGSWSVSISDRAMRPDGSYDLPPELVKTTYSPIKKEISDLIKSGVKVEFCELVQGADSFRVKL